MVQPSPLSSGCPLRSVVAPSKGKTIPLMLRLRGWPATCAARPARTKEARERVLDRFTRDRILAVRRREHDVPLSLMAAIDGGLKIGDFTLTAPPSLEWLEWCHSSPPKIKADSPKVEATWASKRDRRLRGPKRTLALALLGTVAAGQLVMAAAAPQKVIPARVTSASGHESAPWDPGELGDVEMGMRGRPTQAEDDLNLFKTMRNLSLEDPWAPGDGGSHGGNADDRVDEAIRKLLQIMRKRHRVDENQLDNRVERYFYRWKDACLEDSTFRAACRRSHDAAVNKRFAGGRPLSSHPRGLRLRGSYDHPPIEEVVWETERALEPVMATGNQRSRTLQVLVAGDRRVHVKDPGDGIGIGALVRMYVRGFGWATGQIEDCLCHRDEVIIYWTGVNEDGVDLRGQSSTVGRAVAAPCVIVPAKECAPMYVVVDQRDL